MLPSDLKSYAVKKYGVEMTATIEENFWYYQEPGAVSFSRDSTKKLKRHIDEVAAMISDPSFPKPSKDNA